MRSRQPDFFLYTTLMASFALILGLGILATPSKGRAQARNAHVSVNSLIHVVNARPALALYTAANQDAGQSTPAAAAPSQPKPVEMPDGEGKELAVQYCQDCHRLTNLTRAHKAADDWKVTVQTMMDSGARVPQENVDTLVQYLAKNFGPRTVAPADPSITHSPASPLTDAAPAVPPPVKAMELPDGEGKAIATKYCQGCHKLTTLTKAHKSLDEWKNTVQSMIPGETKLQADQIDTLVQYLAKNFGLKVDAAPATTTPVSTLP